MDSAWVLFHGLQLWKRKMQGREGMLLQLRVCSQEVSRVRGAWWCFSKALME